MTKKDQAKRCYRFVVVYEKIELKNSSSRSNNGVHLPFILDWP